MMIKEKVTSSNGELLVLSLLKEAHAQVENLALRKCMVTKLVVGCLTCLLPTSYKALVGKNHFSISLSYQALYDHCLHSSWPTCSS